MEITTELIKSLRDQTGVSVMQCKKALEEAHGDMEKALILLRKQSSAAALKKADRIAHDGITVVAHGDKKAVLLVLHCETDFVAKNDDFTTLGNALAQYALNNGVEATKEVAKDMIDPVIQKIGENIQLGPITIFEGGAIGSYVHNNKNAAVVVLEQGSESLARDIAMHITAMRPRFLSKEEVTEEDTIKATEIFAAEVAEQSAGKTEEMKAKMLEGKLQAFLKEQILLEQPFIKDGNKSVGQLLKEAGASIALYEHYAL